jgi:outer membrane protein assembly factor BamE
MQRVVVDAETALQRDLDLSLLDFGVVELLHVPAFDAHDVVVVACALELEDRFPAFEVVAHEQARLLELRQNPVYRREAGVGAFLQQRLVNVFGREVANVAFLEYLEDAQPRQGRFQADGFQVGRGAQRGFPGEGGGVWAIIFGIVYLENVPVSCILRACRAATALPSIIKLVPTVSLLLLTACNWVPAVPGITPHKMEIQQGNVVTQDMVDKLKPGMSKSQVRFALGTPLVLDPFHNDRWDYVYEKQKGGRVIEQRRIVVLFAEDKLLRIDGDVVPARPAPAPQAQSPAAAAKAQSAGAVATPAPVTTGGTEPPAAETTPLR